MDKYEYKLKSEQMLEFMEDGAYNKAAEIADTIDWRRVRNATMLTNVSDIYEKNREYQKSYDILNIAYQRAEGSRKILYRLCVLALKTKNVDEAIDYYDEFVQTAPKDPNRYLLRYQILRARREPIEQQIEALEAFKKGEYIEEWAYELAKLYQEAGMTAECLEECDDLILWFSEGKYVYQAMELKMKYKPLTPSQQEKYNRRYEKSGSTEEIPGIVEYQEEKGRANAAGEAADVQPSQPEVESAEVEVKKIGSTMKLDEALRALLHLEPSPDQRDTEDMSSLVERLAEEEGKTEDLSELEGAMAQIEAVSEYDVVEPRRKAPKIDMDPDLEELLPDPEFEIEEEAEEAEDSGLAISVAEPADGEQRDSPTVGEALSSDLAISVAEFVGETKPDVSGTGALQESNPGAMELSVEEGDVEELVLKAFETEEDKARFDAGRLGIGIVSEAEDEQIAGQLSLEDIMEGFQMGGQDEEESEEEAPTAGTLETKVPEEEIPKVETLGTKVPEEEAPKVETLGTKVPEEEAPKVETLGTRVSKAEVAKAKVPEAKVSKVEVPEKPETKVEEDEPILPPDILQLIEEIENGIPAEHEEEPGENLQMKDLGDFEDYDEDSDDEFEDELLMESDVADEFVDEWTKDSEEGVEEWFEEELTEELSEESGEDVEERFEENLEGFGEDFEDESGAEFEETFAGELTQEAEEWDEPCEDYVDNYDELGESYDEDPDGDSGDGYDENYEEEYDEDSGDGYGGNYEEEYDEDSGYGGNYEEEYDEDSGYGGNYEEEYDEDSDEDSGDGYDGNYEEEYDEDSGDGYGGNYEEEYDENPDDGNYEEEYDEDSDEDSGDGYDGNYEEEYDEDSDEDYGDGSTEDFDEDYEEGDDGDCEDDEEVAEKARPAKRRAPRDDREVPDEDDDKINFLSETAPLSRKETAKLYATGKTAPIPVDEISNALSMSDTGFVVHGRYDLKVQSGIGTRAGLTEDQKKLFSYFVPVRGMSEQLVDVLEQDKNCTTRNGTSSTGNLLIIGNKGNGKTVLAVDVVKAIQKQRNIRQGRVAIVSGDSLNKKRISDIFSKLHEGALIIEKAGKMNEKTVARLNKAMEQETGELLVVLEDQRKPLDRLLTSNREFRRKFTSRLEVPILINDELVTFGQAYAKENGYLIDEMGILALYSRIDEMQREDHPLTIAEVKEVMDQAMDHSQKTSAKKLMRRVLGRGRDSSDRIILGEADF